MDRAKIIDRLTSARLKLQQADTELASAIEHVSDERDRLAIAALQVAAIEIGQVDGYLYTTSVCGIRDEIASEEAKANAGVVS